MPLRSQSPKRTGSGPSLPPSSIGSLFGEEPFLRSCASAKARSAAAFNKVFLFSDIRLIYAAFIRSQGYYMPSPPKNFSQPGTSLAGKSVNRPVLNVARLAAIGILNGVMTEQKQLSEMIQTEDFRNLPSEERARAQRLATHTLRHVGRADRALRPRLVGAEMCIRDSICQNYLLLRF